VTELAKEYGEGLYELAAEENLREQLLEELNALYESFRNEPDFIRLLDTRAVLLSERIEIIDETLKNRAHPYILSFLKILCERGAAHAFCDCAEWFRHRYNQDFGIVEVYVTTAVALSEDRAAALRKKLEEISGKKVVLKETVDPSVLGGVRVEMDGRRIDGTVQGRLCRLRRELNGSD